MITKIDYDEGTLRAYNEAGKEVNLEEWEKWQASLSGDLSLNTSPAKYRDSRDDWPNCACCHEAMTSVIDSDGNCRMICMQCAIGQVHSYPNKRQAIRAYNRMWKERYVED